MLLAFIKDAFPKELFKVLEDSEETWELEETVLQLGIDFMRLFPLL